MNNLCTDCHLFISSVSGFTLGAVAAIFVYREVTHSSYARVPYSADIEADSYDNLRRASTVETLRRRPEPSTSEGENGGRAGSAFSSASTVGRYEGRNDSAGYQLADRGLAPTATAATPTYGSGGAYQQIV
jgi:hypothetical protein